MAFSVKKVVVVGGIHGNEMGGIYAIKKWLSQGSSSPKELQRPGLEDVRAVLANPLAVEKCLRFVHSDLNAAFDQSKWQRHKNDQEEPMVYDNEAELAQKLWRDFTGSDFCVHLHCASSNSGIILLVSKVDGVGLKVAHYVKTKLAPSHDVRVVIVEPRPNSLRNVFPHGIGVEVGPQPPGMLLSQMLSLHMEVTQLVLDGLSYLAKRSSLEDASSLEVFEPTGVTAFPRNESGDLTAAIHPQFQGRDFELLETSTPIFKDFYGSDILYNGEATHPVFINEAAYLARDSAFWMTKKTQLKLD